jgi:protease-4
MVKFLIGVAVGIAVVLLSFVLLLVVALQFREKPPVVAEHSVLVMRLEGELPEKPPLELPALFGGDRAPVTMSAVWSTLEKAAADPRLEAVVLEPQGLQAGWAKLQEIQMDLDHFRKSGKPVFAYLRQPGSRELYAAVGADRLWMGPQEPMMVKGLRAELMYFKKTLDKLGVSVEVEHAGKYKDFGDMFTRTDMSPETREVITSIVDDLYGNLVTRIASGRKKTPEQVKEIIDKGPFTARQALNAGLVDKLGFEDEMWGEIKDRFKSGEPNKVSFDKYRKVTRESLGLQGKSRIAIVVGQGEIVRGEPSNDGAGETELTSYGFTKLLRQVRNDSGVKGVVVRIDSPGGEVTASDEIWREMNLLSKQKPMVISMSDTAASGGYYMAMTGDPIVSYPATLTGSIGVVFGKPNLRGLYEKLGISKDAIQRGRHAGIDSDYTPLTPDERQLLQTGIDESYEDFVRKVAAARHRTVAEIEPVSQGRVWLGSQAKPRGLVDQMGGLDRAIELLKQRAKIPANEQVSISIYPGRQNLFDVLMKRSQEDVVQAKLRQVLGRVPFHAWLHAGMLRTMTSWFTVQ